ncbi:N-acetylmuramoyl-L-alanine amidase family protein [Viridibacillus arvi]|uniref:N-acetylmuramoyl-L-alanine amidase family protein n=1 Tax=Viridibacillus arvi TaxID=263475 RepID=UPI0036E519FA
MKKKSLKYVLATLIGVSLVILVCLMDKIDIKDVEILKTGNNTLSSHTVDSNSRDSKTVNLLNGKTIVIDPGHGGVDGGTIGLSYGTIEKEVNLTVAQTIKQQLEERTGATIILTRDKDIDLGNTQKEALRKRIQIAEKASADLYISIHHDAFIDTDVRGITTHYSSHHKESKNLARIIQKSIFKQSIKAKNRGIKETDYYVLKNNSAPAVLIELGFTSNKEDEIRMNSLDFQSKTAISIVDGIIEFLAS